MPALPIVHHRVASHRRGAVARVTTAAASVVLATAALAGTASAATPSTHTGLPVSPLAVTVPRLNHIVVVVMENHSYSHILGSGSAPYIKSLAAGGASFTKSFAITHPSEPNYLALFSGSTQGVTDDSCPHTFGSANLGRALLNAGRTFAGYSEGLPSTGSAVCSSGPYARKHNPWSDFSNVPATANRTLTAFPTNFLALPSLSFVIPNLNDDMHDGSISQGDAWLKAHLGAYATWAKTNNSALLVTFDEDDNSQANQIPTVLYGAHVRTGSYAEHIDHYRVLRTLAQMYGATPPGAAASSTAITDVWN